MDEEQTPVSHCSPFAKPQTDVAGVVQKEIDIFEKSCARSLHFFGRNRVGTHAVNSGKHDVARFLQRLVLAQLRHAGEEGVGEDWGFRLPRDGEFVAADLE